MYHFQYRLRTHAMLKSIAVCSVGLVTTDRVGKRRKRIVLAGKLQAVFSSSLEAATNFARSESLSETKHDSHQTARLDFKSQTTRYFLANIRHLFLPALSYS